ncbi:hypothetical protein EW026_g1021 [Hermanssonia centrifuga]|uniref:Glycosyltransferase n=1 Tax=Hermanssonia centrifuga TaxID=98765 RepID=A0A4S4KXI2_9APHY|nr:hypothetical protein EW026_g1021 [Hermanssonia centrifuga]
MDWARRGAIRLFPIGEHVKTSFRRVFNERADSTDVSIYTAGYESIPIDVYAPVLNIPDLPQKDLGRVLSKAVIQGSFDVGRRDYPRFLADLVSSFHEDPESWGYHPLEGRAYFVPNHRSPEPPFELAIVGSGALQIPQVLAYVITVYHDVDYNQFYKLIASMDIVVPAFADFGYYEDQASSTIALAVELDIPILATKRMRQAYGYIDDDRVVVTRPAAMREVQALKALRTRNSTHFLASDPAGDGRKMADIPGLETAVQKMITQGWARQKEAVTQYKKELWENNGKVVERLLGFDQP